MILKSITLSNINFHYKKNLKGIYYVHYGRQRVRRKR